MISEDAIKELIRRINQPSNSQDVAGESDEFWQESGARLLIFIDQLAQNAEIAINWVPKNQSNDSYCILSAMFNILANMIDVNKSFKSNFWEDRRTYNPDSENVENCDEENMISFYELALSRCCLLICLQRGDRFPYIQKILIKNLFSPTDVCSFFASDIYMFILRTIHPHRRMAMCQIIINLCRLAPPEALVKGAALVNRFKHPIVNFENSKYQYLLDFA